MWTETFSVQKGDNNLEQNSPIFKQCQPVSCSEVIGRSKLKVKTNTCMYIIGQNWIIINTQLVNEKNTFLGLVTLTFLYRYKAPYFNQFFLASPCALKIIYKKHYTLSSNIKHF